MITVETTIKSTIEKVWQLWTQPEHIINWYFASDDWCAPKAENDLYPGGKFKITMAAKDGSVSFDFSGVYTEVKNLEHIAYLLDDNREVVITFVNTPATVTITQSFEAEETHPHPIQQAGWQSILDNFKKYAEGNKNTPAQP